jgi:hypothetical protein
VPRKRSPEHRHEHRRQAHVGALELVQAEGFGAGVRRTSGASHAPSTGRSSLSGTTDRAHAVLVQYRIRRIPRPRPAGDRHVAGAERLARACRQRGRRGPEVERRRHVLDAADDGELAPALLELRAALGGLARQGRANRVAIERRCSGGGDASSSRSAREAARATVSA